ncbi:hypothetical protein EI94DRAFT_1830033 [Lactarius quietus]|nr:hypothetical protein EI94DRAFT_1830033 [Lactarius quietus]
MPQNKEASQFLSGIQGKRRAEIVKNKHTQLKYLKCNYDLLRSAIRSGATKVRCGWLRVAVQEDPVLAELLLKYGPTQLIYTENSVGQTPLDVASLKGLPRVVPGYGIPRPPDLQIHPEQFLRSSKATPVFHVDKQKIEIPKLRATIDTLLANGSIAHGSKLNTELVSFADRGERRLAEKAARESAALSLEEMGELDPWRYMTLPRARTLHCQPEGTFAKRLQLPKATEEEDKEADPEDQRIAELKARSLVAWGTPRIFDPRYVNLYSEDKF